MAAMLTYLCHLGVITSFFTTITTIAQPELLAIGVMLAMAVTAVVQNLLQVVLLFSSLCWCWCMLLADYNMIILHT